MTNAQELEQTQIELAVGDSTTKAPSYLEQPEAWKKTKITDSDDEFTKNIDEQFKSIADRMKK
jgi:hypothetical protein